MNNLKMFKELMDIFITAPIDFSYLKFKVPMKQMDNKLVTGYLIKSALNNGSYRKSTTDISYTKLKKSFEKILCNRYKKRNKLSLISQNFIINKYAHQYNQSVLLNSIKNLEIYHRNFVEREKEIDENLIRDKEIVLKFINNNIQDKNNIEKFERNINYDPELTLYNRLLELFGNLNEELLKKLLRTSSEVSNKEIKTFSYKLVNTRNYYTHGDSKISKDMVIKDNYELIETTTFINQIIKYYICKELFDLDDEIIEIITKGMVGVIK